jgi:hypothetical protein
MKSHHHVDVPRDAFDRVGRCMARVQEEKLVPPWGGAKIFVPGLHRENGPVADDSDHPTTAHPANANARY